MKRKFDFKEFSIRMSTAMGGFFGTNSALKGNPLMLVIAAVILFFSIRSLGKDNKPAEKSKQPKKNTRAIEREFTEAVEKRNQAMSDDPMAMSADALVREQEARKRKKK
ncbi:MAG: hypothetical protein IJP30_00235 [Clostridia bacterium]|nr:hypothetical protein [Clostridia bacterium]